MKQMPKRAVTIQSSLRNLNHLPHAMKVNHVSNEELGDRLHYDESMISKIRTGKAQLQFDRIQEMFEALPTDSQFLALEVANKMVGVTVPVLDGDRVIKEPLAITVKTMPQLSQALNAIQNSLDEMTIPDDQLTSEDFKDPEESVRQLLDAVFYSTNLIAMICRMFHFSMQGELTERSKRWKEKKELK
ncbi:helix-turn-helix domain-containing protein [Schleiferilactobacillus shenzhenensis]|nr:helix-turn-helix transcriptional regulator [Schleiferilactobacillus shenzhenensis]